MHEKIVYVVARSDIEIPPGKLAAQVAHACCGLAWDLQRRDPAGFWRVHEWMAGGLQKKVVVSSPISGIQAIMEEAKESHLPYYLVTDLGLTVFGEPTITCLAVGPITREERGPRLKRARLY